MSPAPYDLRDPGAEAEVVIQGPATLRELSFAGTGVEDLDLFIHWDDHPLPAVRAPLRSFFGGFQAAVLHATPGLLQSRFPMPFRRQARIRLVNPTSARGSVQLRFAAASGPDD